MSDVACGVCGAHEKMFDMSDTGLMLGGMEAPCPKENGILPKPTKDKVKELGNCDIGKMGTTWKMGEMLHNQLQQK